MKGLQVSNDIFAVSEQFSADEFTISFTQKSREWCSIHFNHKDKLISVVMKQDAVDNSYLLGIASHYCACHKCFIKQQVKTKNLYDYIVTTTIV